MRKIVISSDYVNLNRFLKDEREQYFYVSLNLDCIDIEGFLKEMNFKKVDINEGRNSIDFGKEYVDFIGRLNRDYNSLYWWATTISYKGTFGSNLCKEIFNYYCVVSLIKKQDCNYIILSDNSIFNYSIKGYCEGIGAECRLLDAKKSKGSIVHFRRCLKSSIYFLCQGWTRKIWTFIYLSRDIKRLLKKDKSYYVIKSWVDKGSFLNGDTYKDLFFGRLPEYLREKKEEFIVLAGMLTDYKDMLLKIRRIKEFLIIPQEYFVGYLDYLKVIALNFINRPKIARPVTFCGLEVTDFVRECIKKDYEDNEINKNLIYYYYVKGFLKKIKVHTFLFPFEGQSWERMSILAIRKHSPLTKTMGYAHASLPPYLLNYFYSKEERDIVPLPDKILTAGKEVRMILEESGNYNDKVRFREGCALRYEYIFKKDRMARSKNGQILAALSMDIGYSLKLLKLLSNTLRGTDRYKVVLRSHPFTPVEMITRLYNLRLGHNFRISKSQSFEDDIAGSSLVVYVDTTASMEALMCGVPVVHVDLKEPISLDPLFRLNSLKWTVSDRDELFRVIDCIYNMDDEEYMRKYNEALSYLKGYFYPVEENYLKEFIV